MKTVSRMHRLFVNLFAAPVAYGQGKYKPSDRYREVVSRPWGDLISAVEIYRELLAWKLVHAG